MRDRTPRYIGRVRLSPVSGQSNVYDMQRADDPIIAGSAYNKANVLPDYVCDYLGIDRDSSEPKDAFYQLERHVDANVWQRIAIISSSGTYTIPAGVYKIGVFLVSAGQNGSHTYYYTSGSNGNTITQGNGNGGNSGKTRAYVLNTSPGAQFQVTIGAPSWGDTYFGGLTTSGGSYTPYNNARYTSLTIAGYLIPDTVNTFSGVAGGLHGNIDLVNPFEPAMDICASGSSAVMDGNRIYCQDGVTTDFGKGGGSNPNGGGDGTGYGNGGGSCYAYGNGAGYAGKGSPGAVFVYKQGV